MNFDYNLDSFNKLSYEEWLTQVEKQLGKSLSSLDSNLTEDISIKAIYENKDKELNPNPQNETKLFDRELIKNYDNVLYFSDYVKDGIDTISELAFILYSTIKEYDKNKNLLLVVGLNSNIYLNISKLRALRLLLNALSSELELREFKFDILACVSPINKSVLDKENNLIRQSAEIFSAILGNADYVETLPYSLDYNDEFATRISKNIFHIIDKETYLTKILDPVKGSYFFEELTSELISKSLDLFKEFSKLSNDDVFEIIDKKIKANNKILSDNIKSRKTKLLGVNVYSNNKDKITKLNNSGFSKLFEEFRLKSEEYEKEHGSKAKIYLVTFGLLADIKARIDFIVDFFSCGGFECEISNQFEMIEDAVSTIDLKNYNLNIIVSTDELYKEIVPDLTSTIKKFNPDCKLYLAGKPKDDFQRYSEIGIDNYIHLNSNIYEELKLTWELYSI
jgi:methylmalonyl-CoA mutase